LLQKDFAQATWTQGLADWISGRVGALEAIGGVPVLLVPDNTKVAVIKTWSMPTTEGYANLGKSNSSKYFPRPAIGPPGRWSLTFELVPESPDHHNM
jgi:hypothetical protein